ncbi:LysR substrate-binding domain-containing protein [Phyllobacterium ifriqiyense]|uniref:LysR substrate-binding domain-containing protein n=1 Tax=Phyllobacterium ifriqiyense TaxID=314238 RepID=UPI003395CD84
MIETRLLRQFIAVAEELHFNRAALRLHMAQPPLSQAIRRLEAEVGFNLFERTNRRVALTPAGASFLQTAREILLSLDNGLARTRRVAKGVDGHITMTFINIAPYSSLLRALRTFRGAHPTVEFTMREAPTHEQVKALESGVADIGILRSPGTTTPELCYETIFFEPFVAALPAGHRLQSHDSIPLNALSSESFVASSRALGQGFHDQIISLCQAAGFSPRITQEARRLPTLIALVASGFGVALVPSSLASNARGDVVFRPISVDAPDNIRHLKLLMAWNRGQGSAVRDRLIDEIRGSMGPDASNKT